MGGSHIVDRSDFIFAVEGILAHEMRLEGGPSGVGKGDAIVVEGHVPGG